MTAVTASSDLMYDAIRRYEDADNPSAFLAVNSGNQYFTEPGVEGVIAYRQTGRYLVQFGGPFAPPAAYDRLLARFRAFAAEQNRTVVAVQLQRADAERYVEAGFTVNQVGASYAIDLRRFSLQGTRFMRLRNKIARSHNAGLSVFEASYADWAPAMRELDQTWLRGKGEGVKQLEFLVGEYGGEMQRYRRLFVGTINGELAGYISYAPVFGTRSGWMHDLSRRIPDNLPGVMESINKAAIETFSSEGIDWLHFGFTPFTGLDPQHELPGHDLGFSHLMRLLWEHGEAVYPAQTQLAYKQKWAQHLLLPEYVAFDGPADLAGFVHVFRACGAL